eukprot:6212374-Pleurochrysis_carterae.AAC.3
MLLQMRRRLLLLLLLLRLPPALRSCRLLQRLRRLRLWSLTRRRTRCASGRLAALLEVEHLGQPGRGRGWEKRRGRARLRGRQGDSGMIALRANKSFNSSCLAGRKSHLF